jgi:ABC-type transport system involved in multi-copper enzyme maturation permease subunit
MRTFVTLVKREIIDHIAYFAGALVTTGLLSGLMISIAMGLEGEDRQYIALGGLIPVTIVLVIGLCALGVNQMYGDRARNISAFLTALPTTRAQIFAARIAAGVVAILILLIPMTIAGGVILGLSADDVPVYRGVLPDLFFSIFLTSLACYSVGIYAGWNRGSLAPTLAVVPVVMLVPLLLVIKGFGLEAMAILSLFIVACLSSAWCRFASSPL